MAIIEKVKSSIIEDIKKAIQEAIQANKINIEKLPDIYLETPRDKAHGDFACNVAMQLAKEAKQSPRNIANIIVENLNKDGYISKVEIAGPGFINFSISDKMLYESVEAVQKERADYGKITLGQHKKLMVEFVSANPTGPMHMGNARGGALGDVIAEVLSWAGYDVTREFYLNDAGNQIEKFKKSLSIRYQQELGKEIELPEDCYQGQDIVEHAKEFIKLYGDKYLDVSEQERGNALCEYALPKNIEKIKKDLADYRINYDVWFSEKSLYENSDIEDTIKCLKDKGLTYEKEGALWLKATEFGAEKDEVLIRNNGIPTYFTGDIAYHRNKFAVRKFDRVIDVWGADHYGHVARMKSGMDAVGCDSSKLEIVLMQLVRLLRNGEVARMSKRSGKSISLSDLIEEVGVDAARFFFNMRSYSSHFDFDLDLAVKQSNDNPVYYVQYAHARICTIINQLKEEGIAVPKVEDVNLKLLKETAEIELMKKISELPEEIRVAAESLDPSRITRYAMEIAGAFHSFYNACRVKVEDQELMKARLLLIESVRIVISNVLGILKVTAPESM